MTKSRWIKKGLAVVDISNLEKVFTVDHVIFKGFKIRDEQGAERNVSRIVGVELNSVNSDGKIDKMVVHSKQLVPFEVATKGKLEAYKFYNREGEYKTW